MNFTRRTFLRSSLGAASLALGAGLMPRRARAAGADRNFLFVYFGGGWDTLMSLDPRDPGRFSESRIDQTKIQLGWDRLPNAYPRDIIQPSGSNIDFGPVMGGISQHFDKMSVVRGISMDTVTHAVGMRYFLTGMTPRGLSAAGSSLGTRIAAQQGKSLPIPNLVSRVETYNEGLPVYSTGLAVNGAVDLVTTLRDGPQAPTGAVRTRLDEFRARTANCDPALLDKKGLMSQVAATQSEARALVEGRLFSLFNLNDRNNPDIVAVRDRYGITNGNAVTPGTQAAIAFQALKHNVAQTVTIELVNGLDTHAGTWATDHADSQAAGWTALGQLVTDLSTTNHDSGGTLLDRTTILVFSEFGRTALINSRDGRDHSLTSSCALIGAGVPHNKVIGASTDVGMAPQAINPMTGEVEEGGTVLNPNNIAASIMQSAGFDTDALRTDGVPALMA